MNVPSSQTKQAAIETALRKSEERFRQVVESAPSAMVMVRANGTIEMVNAQAEKMFGYDRSELLGKSMEILVPERFRGAHPKHRAAFFTAPQSRPMGAGRDLFALRKDGSEFPVEIGLNPIETEDGTQVLSAIVDISDRKHKEERIHAALKEKDILLGEIHHRVKNNLQIICSLLDLQAEGIDDPALTETLRESQNRIRSMALIHQTLYQSQDFARVDFAAFLDTLAPTLISSYGMDPARISLRLDVDRVVLPINDAVPCGLVVNELMSNALKHGFSGGQSGYVGIELANDGADWVTLAVSDNGVGLPTDFDLQSSPTLGMQLVVLLVDQLGGTLEVHPREPTCFKLRFPKKEGG